MPAASRIAEQLGTPLMPWQDQVGSVSQEVDSSGRLVYREVRLTVPRQSGKTTLLLVLILLRALAFPRTNIVYTAQTQNDARKKWSLDWLPELEKSPFASQFRPIRANGQEALLFKNGSRQTLMATTKKSGHGGSIDIGVLDEAFAHPDFRLEQALSPAMITRRNPQLWVVSTAGTPEDSPYLWSKVESGRQFAENGITEGVAYFEWSAEEDADPASPDTWRSCMPALGYTVTLDAIQAEFDKAESLSDFRRAFLNQWVTAMSDPVIPLEVWNRLVDRSSTMVDPVSIAFDVTPDRKYGAICSAGRRGDGLFHIEAVEHGAGTDWIADAVAKLVSRQRPSGVFCDATGPAGSLLADMSSRRVAVTSVSSSQHAHACGLLYDTAMQGRLRHLGTPDLVSALDGATKRQLGDAWAWSRRSSSVDISPLVAATLALWGTVNTTDTVPQVWNLNEMVEQLRQERDGIKEQAGTPVAGHGRPEGSTFVPL